MQAFPSTYQRMRIAQSLLGVVVLVVIVTHIEAQRGRIRARANRERVVRRGHEEHRFASIFVDLHAEFVSAFYFLFCLTSLLNITIKWLTTRIFSIVCLIN